MMVRSRSNKILVLVSIALSIVAAVLVMYFMRNSSSRDEIVDFDQCVAAGNPVLESYPEKCITNGKTFTNPNQVLDKSMFETVRFESGQQRFSLELPNNWGRVIKPLDSDSLYIMGTTQPEGVTEIASSESFGTDAQTVFSVIVHDNFSDPIGAESDFILVNGKENSITGNKYTYTYDQDAEYGIGHMRLAGDRDYEYRFELGDGMTLRVHYSVYGNDPRNFLTTVESIIDSIRIR